MSDIKISYLQEDHMNVKLVKTKIVTALITTFIIILLYGAWFRSLEFILIPFVGVIMMIVFILPLSFICETYLNSLRPVFRILLTLLIQVLIPIFLVFLVEFYVFPFYGIWGCAYFLNSFLFFTVYGVVKGYRTVRRRR
ncbi:hypothetical protein B5M42_000415 [Paenibacillus athensensis]|uniref:Uncharacterized protein n=1 Tax=Paenibacillus athensensis TaxID=1967502 RepID=A0A4Y8Q7B4_9BACL|nr:hypothetical protein [Paenibacillus athensensis]MCD1257298.1 hypothetical protein [Paenibacillus athensensis]